MSHRLTKGHENKISKIKYQNDKVKFKIRKCKRDKFFLHFDLSF